jgi:hypothetical protein
MYCILHTCWRLNVTCDWTKTINPLPYDVFRGAQPMAYGLFGPTDIDDIKCIKEDSDDVMLG